MDESVGNRVITYYDREGREGQIRYRDLMIQMGEDRLVSLSDLLLEEQEKVAEFTRHADRLSDKIRALDPFYDTIERDIGGFNTEARRRTEGMSQLNFEQRIRLLNTYYTPDPTYDRILRELTDFLIEGCEGELSAHSISLIRRAIDYTCRVMRHQSRQTKRPAAIHAMEAARGAAKNGLRPQTIIATLLHDVVEERLDEWTEAMINRELTNPIYGEFSGKRMKQVPSVLRTKIIQKYIDDYNDRASAIYLQIGTTLYDHIRHFPIPARHYEVLNSTMEMVAALSRRRDMSYYSYLQDLLYPKPNAEIDTIPYDHLLGLLEPEFPDMDGLLDSYLRNVQSFYQTQLGEFSVKEEVRRNAFREILAKIFDRLNNTRDMARQEGFSIPRRLYGAGFKNIFFLQAIEDKFRRPGFNTEERRLIEVKFINKPKVAALYQILDDINFLEREYGERDLFAFLEQEIERYKGKRAFRRLTPPGKGGHFDGLIYLFNDITLGRKSNLVELEKRRDKQAEVLVAFKAVIESFLVYPALIREEMEKKKLRSADEASFQPYRIEGMCPNLERRSPAKEQGSDLAGLKTFKRMVT